MTLTQPPTHSENVVRGTLLALLIVPVAIALWVLVASLGIVVGIVAFAIAFGTFWLYQRGAGGTITRAGAWVVTIIVTVTLALCIFFGMMADYAEGVGRHYSISAWNFFFSAAFWPNFTQQFGTVFSQNAIFYLLSIAIAAWASYRVLVRAFRTTARPGAVAAYPPATPSVPPSSVPPTSTPTTYHNDVDAPPTGSADDKTAPPTAGS